MGKQTLTPEQEWAVIHTFEKVDQLPYEKLPELYDRLNLPDTPWPEEMLEAPDGWDSMSERQRFFE